MVWSCSPQAFDAATPQNRIDNPLRIASNTVNHPRRHGVLERQPDEVQAGLLRDRAAVVPRVARRVEDRKVDPVKARLEAAAPYDVAHIESARVVEQWLTLAYGDDARHAPHPGRDEIATLHPDTGRAFGQNGRTRLAADRRLHGEHMPENEPEQQRTEQVAAPKAVRTCLLYTSDAADE